MQIFHNLQLTKLTMSITKGYIILLINEWIANTYIHGVDMKNVSFQIALRDKRNFAKEICLL